MRVVYWPVGVEGGNVFARENLVLKGIDAVGVIKLRGKNNKLL